jgi:HEAT repeat protein
LPSILRQLSSAVGDRTNAANHSVATACLSDPQLLNQIAHGLLGEDDRVAGDCAEVMTQTAAEAPEYVIPYVDALISLLDHPFTRARWEAAHALAEIAGFVPDILRPKQALLQDILRTDRSIIVRDYTVDIVASLAGNSPADAAWTYPILLGCLSRWEGRHAGHALPGLGRVAELLPEHRGEIYRLTAELVDHPRGAVRKAARRLVKALGQA